MKKLLESRLLWGTLLILLGVLFLLENLNLLRVSDWLWVLLIGVGGLIFIGVFLRSRQNWWALIPGLTLLGVALGIGLETFAPNLAERWQGAIVLGSIGLSFALIYTIDRRHWWAIIPFGVLFTLAGVVVLEGFFPETQTPGFFFLGLGLTFVLVALLPTQQGDMRWAWIPASILLLMGVIFIAAMEQALVFLWPAALILLGVYLILRALRPR